jgi:hypothetical protein
MRSAFLSILVLGIEWNVRAEEPLRADLIPLLWRQVAEGAVRHIEDTHDAGHAYPPRPVAPRLMRLRDHAAPYDAILARPRLVPFVPLRAGLESPPAGFGPRSTTKVPRMQGHRSVSVRKRARDADGATVNGITR